MKSIAFFNNKGGVGKTTLACNVAGFLARKFSKNVLVIDCDPQCNSTQLILDESEWGRLYHSSEGADTIYQVLQPLEQGDASISSDLRPRPSASNRFGVSIIPGHPKLSVLEDELSKAWIEVQAGRLGGFRRTSWLHALLKKQASDFDVVVVDVGPSLGSLNRSVLLAVDYFITPMGPDIFSILGIQNMADWISDWLDIYAQGMGFYSSSGKDFDGFDVIENPAIGAGFLGYTVLQYIAKAKAGVRRPTVAFENIIKQVPSEVMSRLGRFMPAHLKPELLRLGDVPNMYSIVALAQAAHAPVGDLSHADGLVGAQAQQQAKYEQMLHDVCERILENMA